MTNTVREIRTDERPKSETEKEIERLVGLSPDKLTREDLKKMLEVQRCYDSLLEIEEELESVKERKKLRKAALEDAVRKLRDHTQNRQLALSFTGS